MGRPSCLAICVGLLAVRTALAAAPSEDAEAEAHIARGRELRELRQDDAALAEFEVADRLHPTPRSLVQIGLAKQALGRWLEAESTVSDALRAKTDPYIARWSATIEASLAQIRMHLGDLIVSGGPAGAEVWVEGRRAGTLPMVAPLRVVAGTLALEVKLAGHYPAHRTVNVPATGLAREAVELTALPGAVLDRLVIPAVPASSRDSGGPSPAERGT